MRMPGITIMTMALVACVDYRFSFSEEHHQTRKAFLLPVLLPEACMLEIPLGEIGQPIASAAD